MSNLSVQFNPGGTAAGEVEIFYNELAEYWSCAVKVAADEEAVVVTNASLSKVKEALVRKFTPKVAKTRVRVLVQDGRDYLPGEVTSITSDWKHEARITLDKAAIKAGRLSSASALTRASKERLFANTEANRALVAQLDEVYQKLKVLETEAFNLRKQLVKADLSSLEE